jgi:hypothetical protein
MVTFVQANSCCNKGYQKQVGFLVAILNLEVGGKS